MNVLLVEDEPRLAAIIDRRLEREGFRVEVSRDGRVGLETLKAGLFDAAIVDVMLPLLDGVTLTREARAAGITTPILMLTAKTEVPDRVVGIDAGADDYLGKPFAFEELVARLRALGRRAGVEPASLRSGDLTMDLVRHEVSYGDTIVDLTLREYELLECFLRRPEQALTRSQLLDHVWDLNFETDTAVVDTYVHYLRKKLAAAGCPNPIATIRGVGYAWRP